MEMCLPSLIVNLVHLRRIDGQECYKMQIRTTDHSKRFQHVTEFIFLTSCMLSAKHISDHADQSHATPVSLMNVNQFRINQRGNDYNPKSDPCLNLV